MGKTVFKYTISFDDDNKEKPKLISETDKGWDKLLRYTACTVGDKKIAKDIVTNLGKSLDGVFNNFILDLSTEGLNKNSRS